MGWQTVKHAAVRWRRYSRLLPLVILILVLSASSAPSFSALTVEWKNDRLSVVAENVPLARVLQEVADQTGLKLEGGDTLHAEVSVSFSAMPLADALDRLLVHVNYLTIDQAPLQGATRPPVALLLFGEKMAPRSYDVRTRAVLPVESPAPDEGAIEESPRDRQRLTALEAAAQRDDMAALRVALFDPAPLIHMRALTLMLEGDTPKTLAFLISVARSNDPAPRLQALELLYINGLVDPSVPFDDAVAGHDIVPLE
jgi:hypothetical protein